jgi:hypothetical protein
MYCYIKKTSNGLPLTGYVELYIEMCYNNYMQPLEWFTERIGKRIYRDDSGCPCGTCHQIIKEGFIVNDEDHAQYIFDSQNDYAQDGCMLNYRDML